MARYRCRTCSQEGTFVYQAGRHECPAGARPTCSSRWASTNCPMNLSTASSMGLGQAELLDNDTSDKD
jgi:hypothetical protein